MVRGLWKTVEVYCNDLKKHEQPVKLEVVQNGFNGYFYACPHYHTYDTKKGEKQCANRISPVEYEKMLDHIGNLIEEADANLEVADLTGHKWKQKGIEFEIAEYSLEKIIVYMINPKQIAH